MQFVSSCITDIGKKRSNNEDWILDWPEKGLYVVADGMGGERHGEVAAQIAVDTLEQHLMEHFTAIRTYRLTRTPDALAKVREVLVGAATRINTAVIEEAEKRGTAGRMGTTLTALLAIDDVGFVLHVGDSRLYLIRNATMTPLTDDHTMYAEYVRKHKREPEVADDSLTQTLTRAMGIAHSIEADVVQLDIRPGDRFLICSDGAHRYFTDAFTADILHHVAVPGIDDFEEKRLLDGAIRAIVDEAYRRGAEDNLSLLFVTARESDERARVEERLLDVAEVARSLPLFSAFDEGQMERLVHDSEVSYHQRYEILSFPLRPEGEILIMIEGQLSVLRKSKQIDVLTAGSIIGEVAFFSEKPVNYTLFVDKPATFLVIRRSVIEALIPEAPQAMARFLWEICRVMAGQILTSVSHIEKVEKR